MQGDLREQVRDYYGEELSTSSDLKTSACETAAAPQPELAALIANLHEETRARYFGCGLIAPERLEGAHALDLGCGAGRDVYVLSQLVGEAGRVVGVDMTDKQLEVAERWKEWHRERFGYKVGNVSFVKGYLESLEALDLPEGGFDVAISNCVLNLATDKAAVLAGLRKLLKPGGEFYFADVYADRPLSDEAKADPILYGECLGGALVWSDFLRLAREAGFAAPRVTAAAEIETYNDDMKALIGDVRFVSATVRLFAAPEGAETAEGAALSYRGGAAALDAQGDEAFDFDLRTRFAKGEAREVDGETAAVIRASRFGPLFDVAPAPGGAAPYETVDPFVEAAPAKGGGCCG